MKTIMNYIIWGLMTFAGNIILLKTKFSNRRNALQPRA